MNEHDIEKDSSSSASELRLKAGAWLRDLRLARGLSQNQLALQLGAPHYSFVSQIETGRARIPDSKLEQYCNALAQEPRGFILDILSFYEVDAYNLIIHTESRENEEDIEAATTSTHLGIVP